MPRIGMNPSRQRKTDYQPARITLAVLTHLPYESGYFENRFTVTRLCLESLLAHTPQPYDLVVFDNGSDPKLVDYLCNLRNQNKIHYLMLSSRNIGKLAALQVISQAAPGEVIAYCDDDVYFLPGWLDRHLEIYDSYPNVGMVTGFYIRSHMVYGIDHTMKFSAHPSVTVQRGKLIPWEDEQHYIDNMGRTLERYEQEIKGCEDVLFTYQGVDALVSAGHHQFICPKHVLQEAIPNKWGGQLMGRMIELDEKIDQMGYLRLSTPRPVTRLLGNVISQEMAEEALSHGIDPGKTVQVTGRSNGFFSRFYRQPFIKRMIQGLYNRLYSILNQGY